MGVDILPMSSASSKQKPKYAAVILRGENTLFKSEELTFRKLIKVLDSNKPNILAIDNIWELAPTQDALQDLIERIPFEITLVQVTGPPTSMQPIHMLAKHCGIQLTSHPTPIQTAEICANLVQIGIGYEVALFEKETQIRISRVHAIGPGGQHQNKYRRHFHAMILEATRDLQNQLDENGIEYDLSVRKADLGLDHSLFTVYSAMNQVNSVIKSYSGSVIRVRITPIKKKEIEFIPLITKEEESSLPLKSLIVGIDPGTTTGIAILDLNGNILALRSGKEISRRDIIRYISEFGSAVMVATDVAPLPKFVEKVATTFKAIIFTPQKSLKVVDKKEIVTDFLKKSNMKVSDAHIRDALACALKAYLSFQNTFEKIHKKMQELNVDIEIPEEKVKVLVMRGYSIYDAISILTFDQEGKEEELVEETEVIDKDKIEELNKKIYLLIDKNLELKRNFEESKVQNTELEQAVKEGKDQISDLQNQIEKIRSKTFYQLKGERMIRTQTAEITRQRKEITTLQADIDKLKDEISSYQSKELILEELKREQVANKIIILKVMDTFSKECIEKVELFPNDVVYMIDGSGGGQTTADQLIAEDIRAIITNTLSHAAFEQFRNAGIPVIPIEEVIEDLKMTEGIYYMDKKQLDTKLKQYKQKQYAMSLQEAELWLQNLITNYRNRQDED